MSGLRAELDACGIHQLKLATPFGEGAVNCYLIEGSPLTLIDCGLNTATTLEQLSELIRGIGYELRDIARLVFTHHHMDHIGLAQTLQRRYHVEVVGLALTADYLANWQEWSQREDGYIAKVLVRHGVEPAIGETIKSYSPIQRSLGAAVMVDKALAEGDQVTAGQATLDVRHVPGHSRADTTFHDVDSRVLFGGDHLLAGVSSNALLSLPLDGEEPAHGRSRPLLEYRESLARTRALAVDFVLSGHGGLITDHRELIDRRIAEQDRRAERFLAILQAGPKSAYEIAAGIWPEAVLSQTFLVISEVLGHLDLLLAKGLVQEHFGAGRAWFEAT